MVDQVLRLQPESELMSTVTQDLSWIEGVSGVINVTTEGEHPTRLRVDLVTIESADHLRTLLTLLEIYSWIPVRDPYTEIVEDN